MQHVYLITNVFTGHHYVGVTHTDKLKTVNTELWGELPLRQAQHWAALTYGKHYNWKLQQAWDEGSSDDFIFEVVETLDCDRLEALKAERSWIQSLDKVYNIVGRERYQRVHLRHRPDVVRDIRRRLQNGEKGFIVARDLGLNIGTVSLIKNGRMYAYVQ